MTELRKAITEVLQRRLLADSPDYWPDLELWAEDVVDEVIPRLNSRIEELQIKLLRERAARHAEKADWVRWRDLAAFELVRLADGRSDYNDWRCSFCDTSMFNQMNWKGETPNLVDLVAAAAYHRKTCPDD